MNPIQSNNRLKKKNKKFKVILQNLINFIKQPIKQQSNEII